MYSLKLTSLGATPDFDRLCNYRLLQLMEVYPDRIMSFRGQLGSVLRAEELVREKLEQLYQVRLLIVAPPKDGGVKNVRVNLCLHFCTKRGQHYCIIYFIILL